MCVVLGSTAPDVAAQAPVVVSELPVRRVTVNELPRLLVMDRGKNVIMLLYQTTCVRSQALVPFAIDLAAKAADRDVVIRAFATDAQPSGIGPFARAVVLPHEPLQLGKWRSGALIAALEPLGVKVPKEWWSPFIAVFDREGRVLGQWEHPDGDAVMATARALSEIGTALR